MAAYFEIQHKDQEAEKIYCQPIMPIGRDNTNSIQINDPMSSRSHAVLNCTASNKVYITDMGSRNGVYINKKRIDAPHELKDSDCFVIGNTKIIYHANEGGTRPDDDFQLEDSYLHPEIKSVIIMVADIRGFTTLSEKTPIEVLTKLMDSWFKKTRLIVEKHFGIVDKFIGDCIMAKWELKHPDPAVVPLILSCVEEIAKYTQSLNETFPNLAHKLEIGCGINAGSVALSENSILGDVVNTAFRLESSSNLFLATSS